MKRYYFIFLRITICGEVGQGQVVFRYVLKGESETLSVQESTYVCSLFLGKHSSEVFTT